MTGVQGELQKDKRFIQISVEDTGVGINVKDLEKIFDPFEQADSANGHKFLGTGLGLSLTRNFVELHGGKIWAESEGEGKGSKFNIILPF
jgi:signal transduction histidine kinase